MGVRGSLTWLLGDETAGHPRAAWEAAGVRSSTELERWQEVGAESPADVKAWRRVVDGPDEAVGWSSRGLAAQHVNAWKRLVSGFDELDSWIRLGITDLQDIHAWKSVCSGLDEVARWQRVGVDATSVRHWRHLGVNPRDTRRWARLGLHKLDTVAQWSRWGFDPASARPWRRRGTAPDVAGAWHQHGFDVRRSRPWRRLGVTAADAAAFRDAHVRPILARRWLRDGFEPADARAWMTARIRLWQAREWRDLGVSASDAVEWQRSLSNRKAAIPWLEEDIRSPQAARAWADRGGSPEQARPWIDCRFSADEAAAWQLRSGLGEGLDPAREAALAEAWRAKRFTAELTARWHPVVPDPTDARLWRRLVGEPDGVWPWREAGIDDPSTAARFAAAGMSPSEAAAWTRLGVLGVDAILRMRDRWTLADASQWCDALGCDLERAWQWRKLANDSLARATAWRLAGARSPEEAWAWSDAGHDPRELRDWLRAGVSGHTEVAALSAAGIEPDDLRRWRKIGVRPVADDIVDWSGRWSLDEAERWCEACGEEVAEAWHWAVAVDHDLDAVARWRAIDVDSHEVVHEAARDAGEGSAATALELFEDLAAAGLTPVQVFEWLRHLTADEVLGWSRCGLTDHTAVAAWQGQQFTPETCARWRPVVDDPTKAHAWRDAVGEAELVPMWRAAGVDDPAVADQFVAAGLEPDEVAAWDRVGAVGVDVVMRWRDRWSPTEASRWCRALDDDLDQAWRWYELADGDLAKAAAWQSVEGSPDTAIAWAESGLDVDAVSAWAAAGVSGYDEVEALTAAGIGPDDVQRWRRLGVGPSAADVLSWTRRWSLDDAERWCDEARGNLVSAWQWAEAVDRDLDAIARWRVVGVDDPEVVGDAVAVTGSESPVVALQRFEELVAAGLPMAAHGFAWLRAMQGDETLAWLQLGFVDPGEALAWRAKGFTPETCAAWRTVVDEPGIARAWRRVTDDPGVVRAWRDAGVDDPRSVARLVEHGIDPPQAAGWNRLGVREVGGMVLWRQRWPLAKALAWCDALASELGRAWWWHRLADGDLDLALGWKAADDAGDDDDVDVAVDAVSEAPDETAPAGS